jgi:hypothetical protein
MDTIDNPNETANKPATSTPSAEENIIALLAELTKSVNSIASRIDTMEHRFEDLDRDVLRALGTDARAEEESADVEPHTAPLAPSFALRCDGRVLLSTRDLGDVDLSGRETFTGIVLSEAEAADAFDRLANAFEEAAAHGAGWLVRQSKKKAKGEKDESGE